jgi:hypothetical protein
LKRILKPNPHLQHFPALKSEISVLDAVFCAAGEQTCGHEPFRFDFCIALQEKLIFGLGLLAFEEARIDVIAPSFATLTGISTGKVNRDLVPVDGALLIDDLNQSRVFPGFEFCPCCRRAAASHEDNEVNG